MASNNLIIFNLIVNSAYILEEADEKGEFETSNWLRDAEIVKGDTWDFYKIINDLL